VAARGIVATRLDETRERLARVEADLVHRGERHDADLVQLRRADVARAELEALREQGTRLTDEPDTLQFVRNELQRERDQVQVLRSQLDAADQKRRLVISEYSARIRALEQRVSTLQLTLRDTRDDIERAAASRAWRMGHRLTSAAARAVLRPSRTEGALSQALARIARVDDAAPDADDEDEPAQPLPRPERRPPRSPKLADCRASLAHELRFRLGPIPELDRWPSVTAVVVNRDGRQELEWLLAGLSDRTSYPALDLIVVDNGSMDASVQFLKDARPGFAVQVLSGEAALSFSEANARGVAAASGELVLFLNNDVEPFESGWLKEMVAALELGEAGAVGATLIRPELDDVEHPDPIVQHRAVRLERVGGQIRAVNAGDGRPLWETEFGTELDAAAVSGACLLMRREQFEHLGGFAREYHYGLEDVDLGLRLTAAGERVVATGRAVLVHAEGSSRLHRSGDSRRLDRAANRRALLERWGPRVRREYHLGRLRRSGVYTDRGGPHLAITVTSLDPADGWGDWISAHELGEALEQLGWRLSYIQRRNDDWYELPEDVDYVMSLIDLFDLRRVPDDVTTIVWIRNWTDRWLERPWFARADAILASSRRSAALIEQHTGRRAELFPLAANPARFSPTTPDPALAADYIFTGNRWGEPRELEQALAPRRSERFRIYGRGWEKHKRLAKAIAGPLQYDRLPQAYASARLVIDDGQGPTLPYGAVNGRVFEALAAGTLVLTNCADGVHELFDADFPVWSDRDDLRERLDELLADDPRRAALAARYRTMVLRDHTYARRAERLRALLVDDQRRLSFCLKIGAPNAEVADAWGDLHFAQAFGRELQRRGHRTRIETLDEWESDAGLVFDVAVHLRGRSRYHVKPGQFNVLWSMSHPDELTGEECDAYDLVCVASDTFATELRVRTRTPVEVLEQATDPRVFYPDPRPEFAHDLVYVANSRNVLRPIVRDLLPTDHDFAIWGANWEGLIDTRYVVAEHIPNDQLRHVYSSARIVLCDHWDDMRERGYISNRIFDALACGAFVISDEVCGLASRFGDRVATYRTPAELHKLIERHLDPAVDHEPASSLSETAPPSFEQRVESLLRSIDRARLT
jgi:GT2 family glycosyltransferase/spore maturation protein CgeB